MSDLKISENVSLTPYTTFRIGGPAKYFFDAKSKDDIIRAIQWSKKNNKKYFLLGGGSNILVADQGFDGLAIKLSINDCQLTNNQIRAESGVNLSKLVLAALNNGLTGLEWAIDIPGTMGGAVRGNSGAFGVSMADIITSVEILKIDTLEMQKLSKQDCRFGYRESRFKQEPKSIILSAEVQLKPGGKEAIKQQMSENLAKRKNQPKEASAGCVFKNIEFVKLDPKLQAALSAEYPEIISLIKGGKLSTGWLIEQCDLKGKQIGRAKISEQHTNFIVNLGGAKAEEVFELISLIKQKVRAKFGLQLQEEIELVI